MRAKTVLTNKPNQHSYVAYCISTHFVVVVAYHGTIFLHWKPTGLLVIKEHSSPQSFNKQQIFCQDPSVQIELKCVSNRIWIIPKEDKQLVELRLNSTMFWTQKLVKGWLENPKSVLSKSKQNCDGWNKVRVLRKSNGVFLHNFQKL